MRIEELTIEASADVWRCLAAYAGWLLEKAEAFDPESEDYCPRIGAQQAARAYLAAEQGARSRRAKWAVTLPVHHWTWLARGMYEAEQHPDRPGTEVPDSRRIAVYLVRLLDRADVWPARHGSTTVDLRAWEWYEVYPPRWKL